MRLPAEQLQPFATGLLASSREGAVLRLSLISHVAVPPDRWTALPAPVIKATEEAWIFHGVERVGAAAYVQEWQLRQFAPIL